MKIQNPVMAGATLNLRYARDKEDGSRPASVSGDERGIFDIPEKDAKFLLSTPGWSPLRKARDAAETPEAPKAVVPPPPPPAPPAEPEDDEPADLSTMDKDELLAYAEEHQIEVGSRWGETRLRAFLEAGGEE